MRPVGFCRQCGAALRPGKRFCVQCGVATQVAAGIEVANRAHQKASAQASVTLPGVTSFLNRLGAVLKTENTAQLTGGAAAAGAWYSLSRLDPSAPAGADWMSPCLILTTSIVLTLLRRPLDILLQPLETLKRRLPRSILILVGLFAPVVLAVYFHQTTFSGDATGQEYALARKSTIWGILWSYVIMRIPDASVLPRGGSVLHRLFAALRSSGGA